MMKFSELNMALGVALTAGSLVSYGFLYSQLPYLNPLGSMVFFIVSIALLPIFLIGLSVALSKSKFQKFATNGFKAGAFLLITLLMYVIWVGPTDWLFLLLFGVITAGLLFTIIKLNENIAKFAFTLFGLIVVSFVLIAAYVFVN